MLFKLRFGTITRKKNTEKEIAYCDRAFFKEYISLFLLRNNNLNVIFY